MPQEKDNNSEVQDPLVTHDPEEMPTAAAIAAVNQHAAREVQKLCFLAPCFDDYECIPDLVAKIAALETGKQCIKPRIVIVNDSPWIQPSQVLLGQLANVHQVEISILDLVVNSGHQRAISVGMAWIDQQQLEYDALIILDSDGEDRPEDALALIHCLEHTGLDACVAVRCSRRENICFRSLYQCYKAIFIICCGKKLNFGNFMALTPYGVKNLLQLDDTPVHLGAALLKSRLPFARKKVARAKRFNGTSKMGGYEHLVVHAFRSLSVLGEQILARLLIFGAMACVAFLLLGLMAIALRFSGLFDFAVSPGWTTLVLLILLGSAVNCSILVFSLALTLVKSRSIRSPVPQDLMLMLVRSYHTFTPEIQEKTRQPG